ncbi:MAG TPA: hypothetical protein VGQ75_07110 [Thermoanaerobaculia bacterium]|nr:hypothetical protein [Thermoanaerobaculia bacterium]
MAFSLIFTEEAKANLRELERDRGLVKRLEAVRMTLAYLETNPRHSSLQTHEYKSLAGPGGKKVFEAYAEQNTPAAFRVFWHYGPGRDQITIVAITRHP